MSEVVKGTGEQSDSGESRWDILTPEKNGLGSFQEYALKKYDKDSGLDVYHNFNTSQSSSAPEQHQSSFELNEWNLKILEDDWTPEWDYQYQNITFPEMHSILRERVEMLDVVVATMDNPDNHIDFQNYYFDDYERTKEIYVGLIEKLKNGEPVIGPPEVLLKNTRSNLAEARFRAQAIKDPKKSLADLEADLATFDELAKAQEKVNFKSVNWLHLHQENAQILNQIPIKKFRELAKQMNAETFEEFDANLKSTLIAALGLDADRILFQAVRNEKFTSYGDCGSPLDVHGNTKTVLGPNDKVRIRLNYARLVDTGKFNEYANTVAHELKHAQQYFQALKDPMSDYWIGDRLYKDGEGSDANNDYMAYRHQKIEWDAFDFGDSFQRRLLLTASDHQIRNALRKLNPRRWFKKSKREETA